MASGELPPSILHTIISEVGNTQTSRYNEIAVVALYVYDLVTTLDKEIELIWLKPMSLLKALFLINRYLAVFTSIFNASVFVSQDPNLSTSLCTNWFKYQAWEAIVSLIVIQMILLIRLWAMYNRNNILLGSMVAFGTLQVAASSAIMGLSLSHALVSSQPAPGFIVCSTVMPSYFAAYWIPILAFETTLFILTLLKGWQNFRKERISTRSGMSGRSLINLLVRDSIIYFFIIDVVYLANAVIWYWAPPTLIEASSCFGIVLPSMMASKLLLNLRDVYYNSKQTSYLQSSVLFSSGNGIEMSRIKESKATGGPSSAFTSSSGADSDRVQDRWEEWGKDEHLEQNGSSAVS